MRFETMGNEQNPVVLFFHAMGVTGASSEPVARFLQANYFCILPTSTVYCAGQRYQSRADEIRQLEQFLHERHITCLSMVVASSIGTDLRRRFWRRQRSLSSMRFSTADSSRRSQRASAA